MTRLTQTILILLLGVALAACGTDTGSGAQTRGFGGASTPGVSMTTSFGGSANRSSFSLRLTDAPIDGLAKVVVQFTAVEMKLQSGDWIRYTLPAPQPIDLLALHGLTTADLLVNMPIEPGDYQQIRFLVDDVPMANYVELIGGGIEPLKVPKATTKGIKIKENFTIPDNRLMNFTVDFDLRKSVKRKKSNGEYKLKAKARLVVDSNVGVIRGTVNPLLLLAPTCSDIDVDTHNAVYVYAGHNTTPGDIDDSSGANAEPLTTTAIKYDSATGLYMFEAAFLPAGDYTVAFTCNSDHEEVAYASEDDSIDDDDIVDDDGIDTDDDALQFFNVQNVSVLLTDTTFLKP